MHGVCSGTRSGQNKVFRHIVGYHVRVFTGILAGHIGIEVNPDMLNFAQNLGLILLCIHWDCKWAPAFLFIQKRRNRIKPAFHCCNCAGYFHDTRISLGIGGFTIQYGRLVFGAVTNTPALGAAQQAFLQLNPADTKGTTDMALACAVTYPLGVVGVILAIVFLRKFFIYKNDTSFSKEHKDPTTYVGEFQVSNPAIYDKSIREIMKLTHKQFVISRVWRDGKVSIPTSETKLLPHDHLLIISVKSDVESIKVLFGEQEQVDWNKEDIDWNAIDSQLISRRVIVTQPKINGVKLGSLKLRNLYGINITRINRAGIDLLASPNLHLQIGDKLTIVGEKNSVNNVVKILGDEVKRLDNPNLIAVFVGITLGVILGALPITIPGMSTPVKLGIAGDPSSWVS